jgi:hypothetical protein
MAGNRLPGDGLMHKLWDLFHKYDEQAVEYMEREGVDVSHAWPHVDVEGRPE